MVLKTKAEKAVLFLRVKGTTTAHHLGYDMVKAPKYKLNIARTFFTSCKKSKTCMRLCFTRMILESKGQPSETARLLPQGHAAAPAFDFLGNPGFRLELAGAPSSVAPDGAVAFAGTGVGAFFISTFLVVSTSISFR